MPNPMLQAIRIEQYCGFIAIGLLYLALLASPLTKAWPGIPLAKLYLHARRAIGVLAFYYAFLHVFVSFFQQLDGFASLGHMDFGFSLSLVCGIFALAILFVMTLTSLDWAVEKMGFKNWKLLHRLVYLAGLAILVHIVIIGPHYAGLGAVSVATSVGLALLLWLEGVRLYRSMHGKTNHVSAS